MSNYLTFKHIHANFLVSINYASDFGEVGTVFNPILLVMKQTQSNFVDISSKWRKWDQATEFSGSIFIVVSVASLTLDKVGEAFRYGRRPTVFS